MIRVIMGPPEPHLQWVSRATVKVGPIQVLGQTAAGVRRFVQILEGRFEGRINGEVLPGGVDYQIVTPGDISYLDARYVIHTTDNAFILVRNYGIRHGVIGDDPSKYYFRSTPRFETSDTRYSWLNKTIVVCSGARTPEMVLLDFYEVL